MYWDKLLKNAQDVYYTYFIMVLLAIALLVAGWRSRPLRAGLGLLVLQAALSIAQTVTSTICLKKTIHDNSHSFWLLGNSNQFVFSLAELLLCSLYIARPVHSRLYKKIIWAGAAAAAIAISLVFADAPTAIKTSSYFFSIESIALTVFCAMYLLDLAGQPIGSSYTRRPEYWAITAMFICFGGGITLFLFMPYFDYKYALSHIYIVNYVLYCLLYASYLKALQVARLPPEEADDEADFDE